MWRPFHNKADYYYYGSENKQAFCWERCSIWLSPERERKVLIQPSFCSEVTALYFRFHTWVTHVTVRWWCFLNLNQPDASGGTLSLLSDWFYPICSAIAKHNSSKLGIFTAALPLSKPFEYFLITHTEYTNSWKKKCGNKFIQALLSTTQPRREDGLQARWLRATEMREGGQSSASKQHRHQDVII